MDAPHSERPPTEATRPTAGATAPTSPSEPLFSLRHGLVGAAKGAAASVALAVVCLSSSIADEFARGGRTSAPRMPWILATVAIVGAATGFAARAPRGSYGFARTLAVVFFGSLPIWVLFFLLEVAEQQVKYLWSASDVIVATCARAGPPVLVAILLTMLRALAAKRAEASSAAAQAGNGPFFADHVATVAVGDSGGVPNDAPDVSTVESSIVVSFVLYVPWVAWAVCNPEIDNLLFVFSLPAYLPVGFASGVFLVDSDFALAAAAPASVAAAACFTRLGRRSARTLLITAIGIFAYDLVAMSIFSWLLANRA